MLSRNYGAVLSQDCRCQPNAQAYKYNVNNMIGLQIKNYYYCNTRNLRNVACIRRYIVIFIYCMHDGETCVKAERCEVNVFLSS